MPDMDLIIIDNLDEFAGKILQELADESDKGRQKFLSQLRHARNDYVKPINAKIKMIGLLYYLTRRRVNEIDRSISSISTFNSLATRLTEFRLLIGKGQWVEGSFNHYLFLQMIGGIPGYSMLRREETQVVIDRLKILILDKLDALIPPNTPVSQSNLLKEKPIKDFYRSPQKNIDHISLTGDLALANIHARQHPEKIQFCLVKREQWQLLWIDNTGVSQKISINKELMSFLELKKISVLSDLDFKKIDIIKRESLNSLESYLKQIKLIINPLDINTKKELSNDELLLKNHTSTFILRVKPNEQSLYWVNSMRNIIEISLSDYPELSSWINTHDIFDGCILPQLKAHLSRVNTSRVLQVESFKDKIENCLFQGRNSLPVRTAKDSAMAENQVAVTPKKISLEQYRDVTLLFGADTKRLKKDVSRSESQAYSRLVLSS